MNADESRSPISVKHKHDHELPTVIHHPEEDMPLLALWLDRAMRNQTRFWGLIAAVVLVTVVLSVLGSGLTLGRATSNQAWTRLEAAKTPGDRVEIAKEFPKTPAERWALLQAATEFYGLGFRDLPANRVSAETYLKKALGLFQKVADEAEPDSPQARVAALGLARTLEASGELTKAVAQYERVAANKAWADTDEARDARRLAALLKTETARTFYADLAAFKATEATLPAGGVGNFDLPLPAGHPPLDGPVVPAPGSTTDPSGRSIEPSPMDIPPPPPPSRPVPAVEPRGEPKATTLPDDVFAPAPSSK